MIVHCATTNAGKLHEFRLAGERFGVEVDSLPGLKLIRPASETGATFEENAVQKALYYATHTTQWLFVDDSGLEVDALGGAPGVLSARFAGEHATDDENNALLLDRLHGARDRSAQFVCVIALARASRLVKTFRGVVRGEIVHAPAGEHGFGYDPLFFYPPFGCTFGEAPVERKVAVSHRARALEDMLHFLRQSE